MMTNALTKAQHAALEIALRDGTVCAGNGVSPRGSVERVNARTIDALVRRGYLTRCYGSEGNMAGRVVEAVRAARVDAGESR